MKALELKIPPPVIFLLFAAAMWAIAHYVAMGGFSVQYQLEITLVIIAIALSFDGWALSRFYKAKTTVNPLTPNKATNLVMTGAYRYSRNPMYVSLFLLLVAWGVWEGNMFGFIVIPLYILYITHFQIKPEERMLEKLFGDDYRRYTQRVRRWI